MALVATVFAPEAARRPDAGRKGFEVHSELKPTGLGMAGSVHCRFSRVLGERGVLFQDGSWNSSGQPPSFGAFTQASGLPGVHLHGAQGFGGPLLQPSAASFRFLPTCQIDAT